MDTAVFNFLNRQQVYVEGVKNFYNDDFEKYIRLITKATEAALRRSGATTMGELSRTEFYRLNKRNNKLIASIFADYNRDFNNTLRKYVRIDAQLQRSAWARIKPTNDFSKVDASSIVSAMNDRTVSAYGDTVKNALNALGKAAQDKVRMRLTSAYADNENIDAVIKDICDLASNRNVSVMRRVANDARALTTTAFQHATSTVTSFFGPIAFECYQWCAVLDSRTTDVCRSRNGTVYKVGEGPLPPAHYRCRSRAVPCDCGDGLGTVPTFFNWLIEQPADFLTDAFGATVARKVNDGELFVADVGDFSTYPPLSLEQFATKAKFLTA